MSRILIAGYGYVGSVLAAGLVADGHEVRALKREATGAMDGVSVVAGSLTARDGLADVPRDFDVAIFTAAPDRSNEEAYRELYLEGMRRLREHLGASTRLVFTSSTAVYGQDDGSVVDEDSATEPASFRGEVLLEAEAVSDRVVRLAGIYGPGRTRPLARLRRGEARIRPGRVSNWIHRDDAAGTLAHVAFLPGAERVYLGVDDEPVDSETFYRWLAAASGLPPPAADPPAGRNKRLSNRRLRDSGYVFRYPTFRQGYEAILDGGRLPPCPSSPSCVSSQAARKRQRIPAVRFESSAEEAERAVAELLREAGGVVERLEPGRLRAELTSRWLRFVDDVDVVIDEESRRIDLRSASRVGYTDLGVNRRRMERLIERLVSRPDFTEAPD